ncbi:MAG: M1 family aminopeptidase [Bacteroidia bacterium]
MKKIIVFTFLFLFSAAVSIAQSCQQNKKNHTNLHLKSLSTRAENSRSDTIDVLKYTINLNITDFTNNTIAGNTVVSFTPKVNNINKIDLDLLQLTIDSVEIAGVNLTYTYNDTLLSVILPNALNTGDTANVFVYYHGTPQGDPAGWGGFYFTSGYAYNLGVGFGANPHTYGRVWFPCFDNFVERSTYEFNITTNNGKVAYCNGFLANDTTDGNGNRTRKWIMNETIPTYLASVAVAAYTHVSQTYNGINGSIPIMLTSLPSDTNNVKSSFVNLNTALSTYENHFGPYLWNRVGYCMVPFDAGAMEHATNIAYPRLTADGSISYQTLYAHELSHHWFGDLATCRTQEDMWLNEGWARYCEFLFEEELYGYNKYLSEVRVNHEENLHFNTPKEGALTLSNIPFEYTYGDHVYNKGADIAHTLRGYMGDSLFFSSVKTYLAQNHYTDVSSADFRDALTAASGINMSDFFNDWVFNPGWPHFAIDSFIVTPSGPLYNVTVYVKQKLKDAPNYYNNVPLEITFKGADWTEKTESFVMSGQAASFTLGLTFNPVFAAVNMGEKISHAVAPDYKTIKTTGSFNFANARMNLTVQSIVDSAFVRIEHNYVAPDGFKNCCPPYRLSPDRYWRVDGVLPSTFKAKANFFYDGRTAATSGNQWLDHGLMTTSEDSLVLMYRKNASHDWQLYPYYTKTMGVTTDKRGTIVIDSLQLGEYTLAMHDYTMSILSMNENKQSKLKLYPNPTKDLLTVDIKELGIKPKQTAILTILNASGQIVFTEQINTTQTSHRVQTNFYNNGVYSVLLTIGNKTIAQSKFVVAR